MSAVDLEQLRQDLAADLRTALDTPTGVTFVTTDPASVHPPCVLVGAVTVMEAAGACAWQVELPVLLVGKAPASALNVAYLGKNLGALLTALGGIAELGDVELTAVEFGGGELPAYLVTTVHAVKE